MEKIVKINFKVLILCCSSYWSNSLGSIGLCSFGFAQVLASFKSHALGKRTGEEWRAFFQGIEIQALGPSSGVRSCSSFFLSLSSLFSLPQIICFRWLLDMLIPKVSLKFFPCFWLELMWDSCPFNSKTSSQYVSSCLYPRSILKFSDANTLLTVDLGEHKICVVYLFLCCCFLLRWEFMTDSLRLRLTNCIAFCKWSLDKAWLLFM